MSIQSEIDRIKAGKADAKAALIERGVDPGDAPIDEYGNQIRAIPTGVTSFNGRGGAVKPQAGDYTSEMVGAINQTEKGRASGVASLDAQGKVPAEQLPEMNYDPARRLIAQHNADKAAHPSILGTIDQFDSRLSLIELQYGTDVNGNPFRVTFENLDEVDVQGVWNQNAKRIEF